MWERDIKSFSFMALIYCDLRRNCLFCFVLWILRKDLVFNSWKLRFVINFYVYLISDFGEGEKNIIVKWLEGMEWGVLMLCFDPNSQKSQSFHLFTYKILIIHGKRNWLWYDYIYTYSTSSRTVRALKVPTLACL